jgi:ribosomal-protein-alanine N-acetyltransferase
MDVPEIETERLYLRLLGMDDLDDYHQKIFADADVMKYLPSGAPLPRERAEVIINRFHSHWERHGFGIWGVVDKASGELIGHCGLQYLADTPEVEVAYALAKPYWGKGLATEAAHTSLRFGFQEKKLERIVAIAIPANIASRRVMEHNGMQYEKDAEYFDLNVAYYSITRAMFLERANGSKG